MKRQPSVHDVSWFLDMHRTRQLDLEPSYQRKSVWTTADRKYFLDTIFRGYPSPPIFVHKTINDNGVSEYHVVDGKQRLQTIILFSENKFALDKTFGDSKLDGKKFNELDGELKKVFWNYSLNVDYLDIDEKTNVNEIFDRINRNSRNLEPQELRHAKFNGWFISEAESEADENPFWEQIKVSTKANAKRMKNVQLVSELLLIIIENKIVGFDQDYLDQKYAQLDNAEEVQALIDVEDYNEKKESIKDTLLAMDRANKSISVYGKSANNIYPLWAVLALKNVELSALEIATRYLDFMNLVQKLTKAENIDAVLQEESNNPLTTKAFSYLKNSRGASTDYNQRNERVQQLFLAITNEDN
jgi:disulfide oxidoreductase YuzD